MVRLKRRHAVEPEIRNLRQHLALARDAVGHDAVEGGDAVAGHEKQPVAQVEDFADLAAFDFADARQFQLQQRFVCHAGKIIGVDESSKSKVQPPLLPARAGLLAQSSKFKIRMLGRNVGNRRGLQMQIGWTSSPPDAWKEERDGERRHKPEWPKRRQSEMSSPSLQLSPHESVRGARE